MPNPLSKREFVTRQVAFSESDGGFVVAAVPVDDVVDYGKDIKAVRGRMTSLTRLEALSGNQVRGITEAASFL